MVSSENADLSENTILIGALEPGGYFTMDAMALPFAEGELNLLVSVSYTDDFNQPRTIEQRLSVMVGPQPVFEPFPGEGGFPEMPVDQQPETLWQKVLRFFKGLLGLGSGKSTPDNLNSPLPGEFQEEIPPNEVPVKPLPAPKG